MSCKHRIDKNMFFPSKHVSVTTKTTNVIKKKTTLREKNTKYSKMGSKVSGVVTEVSTAFLLHISPSPALPSTPGAQGFAAAAQSGSSKKPHTYTHWLIWNQLLF